MTKTSPPEPHTGFQGEGGFGRAQGREDADRVGAASSTCIPTRSRHWKAQLLEGAAGVFGREPDEAAAPPVDLKALHAKIGELALENDFLEGALIKAGMLSAKR